MANAPTTQTNRLLRVTTPLGKDVLLGTGLAGREALSEPYLFTLDLKAERTKSVPFDKLIGVPISVEMELPKNLVRHFHGICVRFEQGESTHLFTDYRMEIVPQFWVLKKTVRSRIFQQMSVKDILKKVLGDGKVDIDIKLNATYHPREYCVQYRESDFDFCSRLMEEEGIFYFFKHAANGHTMVLGDTSQTHPPIPVGPEKVLYKNFHSGEAPGDGVITRMTKTQQLAATKFTSWDHTFEVPHKNQESVKPLQTTSKVGKVTHALKSPIEAEVYDWPGGYAKRFDGVNKGGGDQSAETGKIAPTGSQVITTRAEREAAAGIAVLGSSTCRHFNSGHKFTLETVKDDTHALPLQLDGQYVLTEVTHSARAMGNIPGSPEQGGSTYANEFRALPADVPFRPARVTPRPVVPGTQSAQVVGPAGEEIFTDKYGRVKVQFHWDRDGKRDAGSSCWARVAFGSAGRNWGMIAIPRIGQEVLVDFLEGDPDRPVVVGAVYNPDQMPPYKLPDNRTRSTWKSNSCAGGHGYNEIRFEDKKDAEQIFIHAQKNLDERVIYDSKEIVGHDGHRRVGFELKSDESGDQTSEKKVGSQYEEVAVDNHLKVHRSQFEHVGGDYQLLVGGVDGKGEFDVHVKADKKELIDGTSHLHVKTARKTKVDGGDSLTVGGGRHVKVGSLYALEAAQEVHIKAGMKVIIEAGAQISLKGPGGFIDIGPTGVTIQGTMVLINSGGAAGAGSGCKAEAPQDPKDASPTKPKDADKDKTGQKSCN